MRSDLPYHHLIYHLPESPANNLFQYIRNPAPHAATRRRNPALLALRRHSQI
jgi:hypothetical protein